MISTSVVIDSAMGMHLRPATAMCTEAAKYKSRVYFKTEDGREFNAKSIISTIASGVKFNGIITLYADGPDEEIALQEVEMALKESLSRS